MAGGLVVAEGAVRARLGGLDLAHREAEDVPDHLVALSHRPGHPRS